MGPPSHIFYEIAVTGSFEAVYNPDSRSVLQPVSLHAAVIHQRSEGLLLGTKRQCLYEEGPDLDRGAKKRRSAEWAGRQTDYNRFNKHTYRLSHMPLQAQRAEELHVSQRASISSAQLCRGCHRAVVLLFF